MASSIDTDSTVGLEDQEFDYIIVGGGTSGLVVASRLSEDPKKAILVLEAGTNRLEDPRLLILGLGLSVHGNPEFDWGFWSIPQEQLNGRKLPGTKGKTLGGSSTINFGNVIFPSRAGVEACGSFGNPGWNWDAYEPYITKFHTATGPSEEVREYLKGLQWTEGDYGSTGPVQISFGKDYLPYHAAWIETIKELGYELTEEPIKGVGTGPFINPGTIDPKTHTRSHSGVAYYPPSVQQRPNLRVYTLAANKEVILAAGASQSPQILELSGIGDADILKSFGIHTIIDSKGVGENLQDHANLSFSYEVAKGMPSADRAREPDFAAQSMESFKKEGRGPLTTMPCVPAVIPYPGFSEESRRALLSKMINPAQETKVPGQLKQYEAIRRRLIQSKASCEYLLTPSQISARAGESTKEIYGLRHPGYFISLTAILSYPLSRGSVHLQSADPHAAPRIDNGILRHPADLELLSRHAMWMDKIPETEPLASLLKKGGKRLHTPERVTDLNKTQDLVKELAISTYHLCGTCTMMPREDGGVVDPRLKVYGTRNLRIVDASIFPLIPRGNIQTTVYSVAEKAADMIKEDAEPS